jgi:hypothetical protein
MNAPCTLHRQLEQGRKKSLHPRNHCAQRHPFGRSLSKSLSEAWRVGRGTTGSCPGSEHQKPNQYIVPDIIPNIDINIDSLFEININRLVVDVLMSISTKKTSISGTILEVDPKRLSLPLSISKFGRRYRRKKRRYRVRFWASI